MGINCTYSSFCQETAPSIPPLVSPFRVWGLRAGKTTVETTQRNERPGSLHNFVLSNRGNSVFFPSPLSSPIRVRNHPCLGVFWPAVEINPISSPAVVGPGFLISSLCLSIRFDGLCLVHFLRDQSLLCVLQQSRHCWRVGSELQACECGLLRTCYQTCSVLMKHLHPFLHSSSACVWS